MPKPKKRPQGSGADARGLPNEVLHPFHITGINTGEPADVQGPGYRLRWSGSYVPVEDALVPEYIELTIDTGDGQPTAFERVEVRDGVPQIVEFRLTSSPGQREVRQADLRAVQLTALIDLVAGLSMQVTNYTDRTGGRVILVNPDDDENLNAAVDSMKRARSGKAVRTITPQFLERVAEVYRTNVDGRPTRSVQDHFVVEPRTASEYVQRARRAGLLPPTSPGKKRA